MNTTLTNLTDSELTNLTDSELTDRAAELRKALAATEAEIEVREKVADWPTAQYVWG